MTTFFDLTNYGINCYLNTIPDNTQTLKPYAGRKHGGIGCMAIIREASCESPKTRGL